MRDETLWGQFQRSRFLVWDAAPDLAQATWEWPAWRDFRRFPKTRVLHMDRVAALEAQAVRNLNRTVHMSRQAYGN